MNEIKKRRQKDFPDNDPHLGGHGFKTHIEEGILNYFRKKFFCNTLLDIGCGPGGMVEFSRNIGFDSDGIDGDYSLKRNIEILLHDFTKGPYPHNKVYDLGYSCEFVEHVEEQFIENYMSSFSACKHIVMTYAPPETPGYHHVNCNTKDYWISQFSKYNLIYDEKITREIKESSTMERDFFRKNGLYFKNEN